MITTIPQLIKAARGTRSQVEFAQELGVKQSTLSRYELGEANPKAQIIEQCMHLVHWPTQELTLTVDELTDKIRKQLSKEDHAPLRVALSKIIDGLVADKSVSQKPRHKPS